MTPVSNNRRSPRRKALGIALMVAASAAVLGGCVSPVAGPGGLYASPIGNAPVTANATPYSPALVCLGDYARSRSLRAPRIAVGRIADYTGRTESDGSGRRITQGASLMAMSALAKAGVPMVERFDTSVSELELRYANNRLISDSTEAPRPNTPQDYRRILAGQVPGSDFTLVGGITEMNYNIRSSGADVAGGQTNDRNTSGIFRGRMYVMNVAVDLRLVDTRTLEVVDVISYQKQIIGREVSAGVFSFLGDFNVIDVSAGEGGLEPVQLAVRSLIERGTLEMMANLYGAPGPEVCLNGNDPLGPPTRGATGGYVPAYPNQEQNNAATREDPNRWHASRDNVSLRGRF